MKRLPALPSQKVTPKEGDSLESGSLRNKCKLAALAKERHIIPRPWLFQVWPDSASGQERSSPDVTKARGQPKAGGVVPRALPHARPPPSLCELG